MAVHAVTDKEIVHRGNDVPSPAPELLMEQVAESASLADRKLRSDGAMALLPRWAIEKFERTHQLPQLKKHLIAYYMHLQYFCVCRGTAAVLPRNSLSRSNTLWERRQVVYTEDVKVAPYDAEAAVRSAGLRCTPGRVRVLEIIAAAEHAMSTREVMKHLPSYTDEVTTHRTLVTLAEKGILHRMNSATKGFVFALSRPESESRRHAHFVCDDCGKVVCMEGDGIPKLPEHVKVAKGFHLRHAELVLHGSCPDCAH